MKKENVNLFPALKTSMISGILGFVVMSMAVFIFALVMLGGALSEEAAPVLAVISSAIGAFSGGFIAGLKFKKSGLLVGLFVGLTMFSVIFVTRLLFSETFIFDIELIAISVCVIIFSIIASVIATNLKIKNNKNIWRYSK